MGFKSCGVRVTGISDPTTIAGSIFGMLDFELLGLQSLSNLMKFLLKVDDCWLHLGVYIEEVSSHPEPRFPSLSAPVVSGNILSTSHLLR